MVKYAVMVYTNRTPSVTGSLRLRVEVPARVVQGIEERSAVMHDPMRTLPGGLVQIPPSMDPFYREIEELARRLLQNNIPDGIGKNPSGVFVKWIDETGGQPRTRHATGRRKDRGRRKGRSLVRSGTRGT